MKDTKICPFCGEQIPEESTVCEICGEDLPQVETSQVEKPKDDFPSGIFSSKKKKSGFVPLLDSIYWDQQNPDEIVYKYPKNDITLGSVLTVRDSQEAYFFKNGVLCDKFKSGRHTLSTQNLPILNKIINIPSKGESTFLAEVWFVNKIEKRNMLWGTGGMRIIDPYFEIPVKVSSRGQYGIRINDGGLFLKKLIGTMGIAETRLILNQFRSDVVEGVKIGIAKYMKANSLNINELGTEYRKLARFVAEDLKETFDEYGIEVLNFNIEDISIDEKDPGYQKVLDGIAENARLGKLGVNYVQQKQIDIAQTAAGNEGAGVFMGMGIGMGAGQQIGQTVANAVQGSGFAVPSAPKQPSPSFYVAINGQTAGPFNIEKIREMIMAGQIEASTYVCRMGNREWAYAETQPEIIDIFTQLMPPPPPPSI